jgi:hypothetical protein
MFDGLNVELELGGEAMIQGAYGVRRWLAKGSARSVLIPCLVLLGVSLLVGSGSLARLPVPYLDEPFFNYPAVRQLQGNGLNWTVRADQPFADRQWALHGTFYPWLQVATFSFLGVSQLAARLPQFVAAHLAVACLAIALVRRGLRLAPLCIVVAWLGDTVYQEMRYGRPEGLCLLAIVVAFLALLSWFETGSARWPVVAAIGAGSAFGFSSGAAVLGALLLLPFLVHARGKDRLRFALAYAAGMAVPALLYLLTVHGDPASALAQLRFNLRMTGMGEGAGVELGSRLGKLIRVRRWAGPWTAFTFALTVIASAWIVRAVRAKTVAGLEPKRASANGAPSEALRLAAGWVTLAGFVMFLLSPKLPYYLVLWTPWPMLVLALWLEQAKGRPALLAVLAAVILWLPCTAWNLLRLREAVLYRKQLDLSHLSETLRAKVPANARVVGSPELFAYASEVGLDFVPLPFYGDHVTPDASAWLLVSVHEMETPGTTRIAADALSSRSTPLHFEAFPGVRQNEYPLLLYPPITGGPVVSK